MNDNARKQGYLLEEFRLFHLTSAAGIRTDYHYHEFCKLLLLVSGSGGYWIEGKRYALEPGDMVLVGDGCVHRPDFEAGTAYERIIIYISPEYLRRLSTPGCDLYACFREPFGHVLRPGREGHRLFSAARELEWELGSGAYGSDVICTGLLSGLLVRISRALRSGSTLQPGAQPVPDRRAAAIAAYIDAHLTEDLNAQLLAEQFYLSKYHMMRTFRAATGCSINGYITQRRLELARRLIAQGMSATESCFRAGFGSYSSFTRTCTRYFGATPTGRRSDPRPIDEGFE